MISFPTWILIALGGHLANGAAFVIDKSLLSQSFKRPATYASIVGVLGILALILLPFGVHVPSTTGWLWIGISGATFVLALWAFFNALSIGEASRVVPVIGSLIPILTLVGTTLFLGERLATTQLIGFGFLVIATGILAGGASKNRLTAPTIGMSILAAILFTVSFVTVKLGYDVDGFLTTFTFSRCVGFLTAIILLAIDQQALHEIADGFFPRKQTSKHRNRNSPTRLAFILVLLAQTLGASGFVLVQYAISLGSAAIVNALQAVQYAFLVIAAFFFAKRAPQLLGEDLTTATVIRKTIAILFVAAGLWLVV